MDKIKVLWIDDECKESNGELTFLGKQFIDSAYEQEIDITPMSSYEEGMHAIEKKPNEWCAVILDIKEQKATSGNATDGYINMYDKIKEFHIRHNQEEPYVFTLSGEKQYQEENVTIRKEIHSEKRVYDKNEGDYFILFQNIRNLKKKSNLFKIRLEYNDVLTAANSLGDEAQERLIKIIRPILSSGNNNRPDQLNEIRKYLEDFIFNKLEKTNFFPDNCVSLNERSRYIGEKGSPAPEYIKRSIHSLVSITQEGSHGRTIIDNDVRYGKAPYLLRSCLFELMNIIFWMKYY